MNEVNSTHPTMPRLFSIALSLCGLCVLWVSVVSAGKTEIANQMRLQFNQADRAVSRFLSYGSLAPSERHIYRNDRTVKHSSVGATYFGSTSGETKPHIS